MAFFSSAIDTLQTLVIALGAGLGVWGVVNLLEGYGSDNPGSNAHVTLRSSNKNDKDRRSTLFRTAQGQIVKKQVITVNSGAVYTAVNCYYLYRWGIKWNTLLSIT